MATGSGTGTPASSGNITKATIFKAILDRLRQHGAELVNIDNELQHVLYDLSGRSNFLTRISTATTVSGTDFVSRPDNTKEIFEITEATDNDILDPIMASEYQLRIDRQSTITSGSPGEYAMLGGKIYLYPQPDDAYTLNIHNSYYHPAGLDSIEFGTTFNEAIITGTLSALWSGQLSARPQSSQMWQTNRAYYESEINKLMALDPHPRAVRYHDL